METTIDSVVIEIESNAEKSSSSLNTLTSTLANIGTKIQPAISKLTEFNNGISQITKGIKNISVDTSGIKNMTEAFSSLQNIGKVTGLKNVLEQLQRIPEITKSLDSKTVESFKNKIQELVKILEPLADKLNVVGIALRNLPDKLNQVSNSISKVNRQTKNSNQLDKFAVALNKLVNIGALVAGFKILSNVLGKFINNSNEYIENLNLFYVSMGKNADRAKEFADNFSEVLGVDPSNVMRYQGIFNVLAEGFGLSSEKAYVMSKNLTQLSYDMSSFLNIPIDEAMQKIKSGFSGEIEPMRAVGVALDQATLQETAYKLGIEQRVATMTRAQKSQLLYYQMMTRTTVMQGDMARTLLQPANAIRVLKQQFTLLARAIGNIFIPMLTAAIPYIMVLTKMLTALAQSIAHFFGFELPTIDTSTLGDVSAGIEDVEDAASGATKELNKMLAPFDELNVIEFGKDTGSGGVGASAGGGELDIPLPEYDALAGILNQNLDEIEKKVKNILPYIEAIAIGFAGWKIASTLMDFLSTLGVVSKAVGARMALGFGLTLAGITLFYNNQEKIIKGDLSWQRIMEATGNSFLIGLGVGLMTGHWELGVVVAGFSLVLQATMQGTTALKDIQQMFEIGKPYLYLDKEGLSDEIDDINKAVQSFRDLEDAIDKTNQKIIDNYQEIETNLKVSEKYNRQLERLVDTNGKVKKSDEARVKLILEELTKALGTEYSLTDGVVTINGEAVNSYNELSQSINENIKIRRKEAELEAYQQSYVENIKQRIQLRMKYDEMNEKSARAFEILDREEKEGLAKTSERYKELAQKAVDADEARKAAAERYITTVKNGVNIEKELTKLEIEMSGEAAEEIVEDNEEMSEAVKENLLSQKTTLQTWSPTIEAEWREMAQNSSRDFVKELSKVDTETQKKILSTINISKNLSPTLISAFRDMATNSRDKYNQILDNLDDDTRLIIETAVDQTGKLTPETAKKWKDLAQTDIDKYNEILGNLDDDTRIIIQDTVGEMEGQQFYVRKVSEELANTAEEGFNLDGLFNVGFYGILGLVRGMGNFDLWDYCWNMGQTVVNSFKSSLGIHSPSTVMASVSKFIPEGIAVGIDRNKNIAIASMQQLTKDIEKTTDSIQNIDTNIFDNGLGNMDNSIVNVNEDITELTNSLEELNQVMGEMDNSSLVSTISNKSVSTGNEDIIDNFTEGIRNGVTDIMTNNNRQPVNVYIGNKKVYSGYGEYANTENNMYGTNVIKV